MLTSLSSVRLGKKLKPTTLLTGDNSEWIEGSPTFLPSTSKPIKMSHNYALSPIELSIVCHSLNTRLISIEKLIEQFSSQLTREAINLAKCYEIEKAEIESLRARLAMELSDNL